MSDCQVLYDATREIFSGFTGEEVLVRPAFEMRAMS